MNLRQIEYFVHVAEWGSFSRAAQALGIAQPALSRQVRALETELRETLLLRNGRGVTLTEAGRRLVEHGQGILQMVHSARADLGARRDEPVGHIVIGLPPSLARELTLPLIDAFRAGLPKASLAIVEGFSAHLSEWLAAGRVDLGLLYNPDPLPALEIEPVLKERLCLIGPASAAGTRRRPPRPVRLAQLAELPLVMPQRGHNFRRLMETSAALQGVRLQVGWEVSSVPAILDLVLAGYGHAALTESAVRHHARREELALAPICEPEIESTLCLVQPVHKRSTALTRRARELLGELVRRI